MKEDIQQYEPKEPSIVAIGAQRVRAFVGDQAASLGDVLWVGDEPTRIVALAGSRRVEAIAFDTSEMRVGQPVRVGEQVAGWPEPTPGATPLDQLQFAPGRDVPLKTATDSPTAFGFSQQQALPIVRHGVTLLLDTGAPDEVFDRLYDRVRHEAGQVVAVANRKLDATHQVLGSNGLALIVATQWAGELAQPLIIEAPPFDIDELLDTIRGGTVLVRTLFDDGLEILAESLDLGHSDTQLLVRSDGTIDLARSASRLTDVASTFGRLGEVRERLAIFGEHDLDDDDRDLLDEANTIEANWI